MFIILYAYRGTQHTLPLEFQRDMVFLTLWVLSSKNPKKFFAKPEAYPGGHPPGGPFWPVQESSFHAGIFSPMGFLATGNTIPTKFDYPDIQKMARNSNFCPKNGQKWHFFTFFVKNNSRFVISAKK